MICNKPIRWYEDQAFDQPILFPIPAKELPNIIIIIIKYHKYYN